jgi:hypothetical protein
VPSDVEMSGPPFHQLYQMALHHLVRWVADGVTPPRAQRMVDAPGGAFARDEHGNTLDGVRCARLDVPRARYISNQTAPRGRRLVGPDGFEERLGEATLRSLYRDTDDYLDRFGRRVDELVAQGWLLAEDVAEQLAGARRAEIPCTPRGSPAPSHSDGRTHVRGPDLGAGLAHP